ncbi:MAG TPA: serine hydrolase domain-containing protein [Bryobacteraceae bacterium]|nr:serine hydrolase domain-containing protein [Bryobacteraceae bacterium]
MIPRRQFLALGAGAAVYAGPLEDRIRRIEEHWRPVASMTRYKAPAVSMAVIRDGVVEWARTYGVAASTGTLFQAGALSEPVTAMAALHMSQFGNFGLDEDVNEKLTAWKAPENEFTKTAKVTVRGILSHTAGLTVDRFPGYEEHEIVPTVRQVLDGESPAKTKPVRVETVPGAEYRHSAGGYTVLQLLLTERFQRSFPVLMDRIVLGRLGMRNSTFAQPLPADRAARTAVGFHETGRSYTGGWNTYPEMAAAGLWTTPTDLCLFAIAVAHAVTGQSNKIVERPAAELMLRPHVGRHGLGFVGKDGWFGLAGANAGYRCEMQCRADGSHGAVVMTNSDSAGPIIRPVMQAIAQESGWPTLP